jgi:hypothetical protein
MEAGSQKTEEGWQVTGDAELRSSMFRILGFVNPGHEALPRHG